jgi:hypothetical protein
MPVRKVAGGWRFGRSGKYKTKKSATRSYRVYLAVKHGWKPTKTRTRSKSRRRR